MTILLVFLLIREVSDSGRVVDIAQPAVERLKPPDPIAPGAPPVTAFRYIEGKQRGRFTGIDLVLDDAGH